MSMEMVAHVREKSNARNSARTLLLNLAIYTNDCCGVAWPGDATLYHDVNVSRQRIHELKNLLEDAGELVIVERTGTTNLYFVAWQGTPLGGTSKDDGRHDPRCPLRHAPAPTSREGSEIPDTQGSEIPDRGGQRFLTRKQSITREKTVAPAAPVAIAPTADKAEARSPFWCPACGVSIPTCAHRTRTREEITASAVRRR